MSDKNTPLWIEITRSIVIPALIPVAIGAGGWYFTYKYNAAQIQNSTAELVLKCSDSLSSDDPTKFMAALTVLKASVKEEDSLNKILDTIKKMQSINIRKIAKSDMEKASALYEILKANNLVDKEFQNLVGQETITRVTGYDQARMFEVEGFRQLIESNYEKSIACFRQADTAVPKYHWAYEIYRLLEKKLPDLKHSNPNVAGRTRKEVLRTILQKYSGKAPQDFLDKARKEVLEALPLGAKAKFGAESSLEHSGGEPKRGP
jgi:hypothetical protein